LLHLISGRLNVKWETRFSNYLICDEVISQLNIMLPIVRRNIDFTTSHHQEENGYGSNYSTYKKISFLVISKINYLCERYDAVIYKPNSHKYITWYPNGRELVSYCWMLTANFRKIIKLMAITLKGNVVIIDICNKTPVKLHHKYFLNLLYVQLSITFILILS